MALELEYVVRLFLTIVVIMVGLGILYSIFTGTSITDTFGGIVDKAVRSVFYGTAYSICEDFNNEEVSLEEFQSLLQSIDKERCGYAKVYLRFSVTEDDIKKMTEITGMRRTVLILEGKSKALGAGSLLIYGSPGPRPLKLYDLVEVKKAGTPEPDILVTVLQQGCDPYDDDCDPYCSFKSGLCDPYCYQHEQSEGALCDIDCVDVNKNGVIDKDFDDICDLDCYNNYTDPNNAYDPDCVKIRLLEKDSICDPDSNGVIDGECDPDCVNPVIGIGYHICDFDCDGNVSEGNPSGLLDEDCYVCDGECNNFCSPACLKGEDEDCINGYGSRSECCGNNICAAGESCENCKKDCPPGTTCEGLYIGSITICCPGPKSDEYGCGIYDVNLGEGGLCYCDIQCNETLICDETNHCCPEGREWNGTECRIIEVFDFVFVPLYYQPNDFDKFKAAAQKAADYFIKKTFGNCPDPENRVKIYFGDPSKPECQGTCSNMCGDCQRLALNCARANFGDNWDKIAAIVDRRVFPCDGGSCYGCASGIPPMNNPPAPTSVSCSPDKCGVSVVTHEVGHTLGQCHECGIARPSDGCPNRDLYDNNFIMCYGPQVYWSPDSYYFLRTNEDWGLGKYMEGCSDVVPT